MFVAVFWALFDQTGSAWVLQAQDMDRYLFGVELLPAQIQAANPFLVMLLIPLFSYAVYPAIERIWRLTELRKIAVGGAMPGSNDRGQEGIAHTGGAP